MSSLRCVSPDSQFHGPELVPTLRHLLHPHWHRRWLHDPVLWGPEVHQTEIRSRLVIHAQAPACWWGLEETLQLHSFPSSQGAPSQAPGGWHRELSYTRPQHCSGTGWPQDGSRIKTVEGISAHWPELEIPGKVKTELGDTYNVANLFPFHMYLYRQLSAGWVQVRYELSRLCKKSWIQRKQ